MTGSDQMPPLSPREDLELEAGFSALRRTAPRPSDALYARVLADAAMVQGQARQPGLGARLAAAWRTIGPAFGGWQGAGAVAASAVLGIMVGYSAADEATLWYAGAAVYEGGLDDPLALLPVEG
ncbi:MAG: hypothetical protein AAF281_09175 [Pseudomonadota bacterium]